MCCDPWGRKELDTTKQLNKNSHYGENMEGTLFLTKEERTYSGAKIASSISDAGKTGQVTCKRIKIRMLPNIINKNKLKMD